MAYTYDTKYGEWVPDDPLGGEHGGHTVPPWDLSLEHAPGDEAPPNQAGYQALLPAPSLEEFGVQPIRSPYIDALATPQPEIQRILFDFKLGGTDVHIGDNILLILLAFGAGYLFLRKDR